jgi:hypothetical protein
MHRQQHHSLLAFTTRENKLGTGTGTGTVNQSARMSAIGDILDYPVTSYFLLFPLLLEFKSFIVQPAEVWQAYLLARLWIDREVLLF